MHSSKIFGVVSLAPERANLISRLFLWSINNIVRIAILAKSADLCVYGQFSFLMLLISNKAGVEYVRPHSDVCIRAGKS